MKKRGYAFKTAWLIIALISIVIVSACGSGEKGSKGSSGESPSSSSQPDKVTTIKWGVKKPTLESDEAVYEKIIQAYMDQKPNVKVELAYTEYTDDAQWNTWLTSQLIGGVAPEVVMNWQIPAMEHYRKNLVIDLKPYLDKNNPYDSRDRSWWDSFANGLINQNMDNTNGAVPSVPLSTVAVKVFYNKALFDKAGISKAPVTYSELLEASEKLKAADIVPFIVPNKSPGDNVLNWIHRMFMDQMIEPVIPELDLNQSGLIDLNEIVAGTSKGIIDLTKSPWKDSLPLITQFSQYWYPGYNGIDNATAEDLFIKQEGAMFMALGHTLRKFVDNPDMKFEVGFFSFPYLTKENSPLAVEKLYEMGGAPLNNHSIPSSAKGDKLEAAVDFLQFLASDKGLAYFTEGLWWTSPLKDAKLPEKMAGMFIEGNTSQLRLLAPATNQKLYQNDTMLGQLYLEGKVTAEEFSEALQKDLVETTTQLMKQNDWNESTGWGTKK